MKAEPFHPSSFRLHPSEVAALSPRRHDDLGHAAHIPHHASLFINIGTTTEEIAKQLMHHVGLRVITNNLNVAAILSGKGDFQVTVAGGVVRPLDRGIVGVYQRPR